MATNRTAARALVSCAALLVFPLAAARAQRNTAPATPAPAHTIQGVVRDTLGKPLDSAEVIIVGKRAAARTDSAGHYRLRDVEPGSYEIRARRIGYQAVTHHADVSENSGITVDFELVRVVHSLTPVISTAKAGGLSGVVGDSSYAALPGVEVRAVGSGQVVRTDSLGAFFLDLKPGSYTVTFRRDHFASRLMGVRLPPDSGKRVMVWLTPQDRAPLREFAHLQELSQRIVMMSGVTSKIYTHDDIMDITRDDLRDVVRRTAMGDVTNCRASLDGEPRDVVSIADIDPDDVEMMEVHLKTPEMPGARPGAARGGRAFIPRGCPMVILWMKP